MRKFLLLLGDIILLYLALFLTLIVRYGRGFEVQLAVHLLPFSFVFATWMLVFFITNLYEIGFAKNTLNFFSELFSSIAVNAVIAMLFFYFVSFFKITPKTNLFIFLVIATLLEFLWRYYFNRLIATSGYKNNTLIVGANEQSQELYDYLLTNPQLGYNALGIIDIEDQAAHSVLEDLIKQKNVKTLVLSPSVYKIPHIIDVFYHLVGFGINFYNLSDFYERTTGRIPLGTIDQTWFLENLASGSRRDYEFFKGIEDLLLSVIGLVLSLPFYPFIILAIKLDSNGPIFIRQHRIGKSGKQFSLIKFRTMFANAPDGSAEGASGPIWASEDDKRTTRVGKFIRRMRIDEWPQFWNTLKGEMSFVGPRPERPEFHGKLQKEIPFYEERYLVKPGLTGWAQIKHKLDFRGGMTIRDTFEKLQHDLYYIKNRSLVLDLGIILKTINILLKKAFR
jgi:exopolysaccharide biosynthesis polyprenyl glycosylphosphotransferase